MAKLVRSIPCGKCDCGVYSMEASMNKKARVFGALEEDEREKAIPDCKKDKDVKCAGANDFHLSLIELDKKLGD